MSTSYKVNWFDILMFIYWPQQFITCYLNIYYENKLSFNNFFRLIGDIIQNFFFNWDSLHARLNSHFEAWSYKKKKHKNIKISNETSWVFPALKSTSHFLHQSQGWGGCCEPPVGLGQSTGWGPGSSTVFLIQNTTFILNLIVIQCHNSISIMNLNKP